MTEQRSSDDRVRMEECLECMSGDDACDKHRSVRYARCPLEHEHVMAADAKGGWVKFEDVQKIVAAKDAQIERLRTSLKTVTAAVYEGVRRKMVKASDAAELLLLEPGEVPDCPEPCCTIDKPLPVKQVIPCFRNLGDGHTCHLHLGHSGPCEWMESFL